MAPSVTSFSAPHATPTQATASATAAVADLLRCMTAAVGSRRRSLTRLLTPTLLVWLYTFSSSVSVVDCLTAPSVVEQSPSLRSAPTADQSASLRDSVAALQQSSASLPRVRRGSSGGDRPCVVGGCGDDEEVSSLGGNSAVQGAAAAAAAAAGMQSDQAAPAPISERQVRW